MASKKKMIQVVFYSLFAIGTVGVAQAIAGEVGGGQQNCCHSFPPPNQPNPNGTATACLDAPCNVGQVCSGTGGTLPDGRPWAEAECVTKPIDAGPPTGIE